MMERQVSQLVRLVDDLLDVSRISRGKIDLRLENVDLSKIIDDAVEAARPSCSEGGVRLTVQKPVVSLILRGDRTRLTQTVGNLLNNSCKFTDRGGEIEVTIECDDREAEIRIRDTGIGIDPAQLPYIFDMFVQADTSLERRVSGLGIGLTLVKKLVEMHGGSVRAFSEGLGRGAEFAIRLPILLESQKLPSESARGTAGTGDRRRVLVVDDNVDSAESLVTLLRMFGHEVQMAHDGIAAVETAARFRPDVVLLDIGLPRLNGYEVAQRIRQEPWGPGVVLIALTGWGQEEDRRRSKDAGFNFHLVKPVDPDDLTKHLNDLAPAGTEPDLREPEMPPI
jgi:CheY-like chemotaxis protein/two-component sensor histidine kinase